jgi:hypothetical protein
MSGTRGIDKPRGLLAVDFFRKVAVKKGVFDVELMDGPILRHGEGENNTDGGWFDDRAESLVEVNARLLCETTNDPTCLVTSKRSIGIEFVTKNPFATDDVGAGRGRDESPGLVLEKSIIFVLHGLAPGRITKSD